MPGSNFLSKPTISPGTTKSSPVTTNFSRGIKTYAPNDTMRSEELYLAQNARFERIGEYKTRRGFSKLYEPIGKEVFYRNEKGNITSVVSGPVREEVTINLTKLLYSVEVEVLSEDETYGVLEMSVFRGEEIIARSCVSHETLTPNLSKVEFIFNNVPELKAGDNITILISMQGGSNREFKVAMGQNNRIFIRMNTASQGYIPNLFEANIDGVKTILFPFISGEKAMLYRLSDGNLIKIRNLPDGVKKVRFNQNLNQIRYTNGKESVQVIDPKQGWISKPVSVKDGHTDTILNQKHSNIMDGQEDNLMYFDAETTTQAVWTYPYGTFFKDKPANSYDVFDVEFYQNFPAILTGDPLTAMFKLGGVIYVQTRNRKYQMFSQTADNWTQQESNAQGGTFSQESVVCDSNYAYFANDKGVYIFDGASERSITEDSIQNVYDSIKNKESISVDLHNNRLFIFFSSSGAENDSCLVYNINLGVWESFDSKTYVAGATARRNTSNRLLCGHSKIGLIMEYGSEDNDYNDLGGAIEFNLNTAYQHFGSPSQRHRITKWRPEFSTAEKPYSVKCGYSLDYQDVVKYAFSINLQNKGIIKESYIWDSPQSYHDKNPQTKLTTTPRVNGEFYRCQIRYQHNAAFEPVNFKSHTLTVQTQRLR